MSFMLQSRNLSFSRRRAGFTIVELLVATAVTAVLAGLLLAMTSGVLTAWNRTSGALSANSQAQMIFDLMTEDLQAAIYRRGGNASFDVGMIREDPAYLRDFRGWRVRSTGEPLFSETAAWGSQAGIKPAGVTQTVDFEASQFGQGGAWLRFLAAPAANGDTPRAISYQMARRPITGPMPGDTGDSTNPAEIRYVLLRSVLDPATTFNRGYDLSEYNNKLNEKGTSGWPGDFPPGALLKPDTSQTIATNVIDFGVRLYVEEAGQLTLYFPADSSFEPAEDNYYYRANGVPGRNSIDPSDIGAILNRHYNSTSGNAFEGEFPDVVDVFVRILTEEGARQIQSLESGRQTVSQADFDRIWDEIALEHSRVFTRRIHVNARPL